MNSEKHKIYDMNLDSREYLPDLYITSALPNPVGKDKLRSEPPANEKLNEEWVEFQNITNRPVDLTALSLFHNTFGDRCMKSGEVFVLAFNGSLVAGGRIRIHSGKGRGMWEDGTNYLYLQREQYVWNNLCGDSIILKQQGHLIDYAIYDPQPHEGAVLARKSGTHQLQ